MEPIKLLSLDEAGSLLNVSRSTLYRMIERGELESATVGQRRRVISSASITAYQQLVLTRGAPA
jgi:excisionase family DNA binding protein